MWKRINKFVRAHTVLSAFLLTVFFALLTMTGGLLFILGNIVEEITGIQIYIAWQLVLSVIGIWFMKKLQVIDEGDFKFKNIGKGFLLSWVILLLAAVMFVLGLISPPESGFLTPSLLYLITVIIYPFIVSGLFEEVVFRGILLKILLKKMGGTKKGIISAFIISAVVFGAAHSVHIIWKNPLELVGDIIFPIAGGMFLGAIYLRTKTLIAPILIHGLFNLFAGGMIWWAFTSKGPVSSVETTLADVITVLIVTLPIVITAFVLLRKVKPDEITAWEKASKQ